MEKLREAVIRHATAEQKKPLSSSQITLIERRLHETFPLGLRMPTHPTYASMIYKAIRELSEEGGSSEDLISEYMKANYEDLPWAHKSYLSHHLKKLCDGGFIVIMANNRYTVPGFTPKNGIKKGRLKRKYGMKHSVSCQQKSQERRAHPEDNTSEKGEFNVINVKKMRSGRSVLVLQEKDKLLGLCSHRTEDKDVNNGCGNQVLVVEDQEEQKQRESEILKKGSKLEEHHNMIAKQSWPEKVKCCHNKGEGTKERSFLDKCQDKIRNDISTLEDYSTGADLITSSQGESSRIPVHEKKKDAIKWADNLIVCGLATKFPKPKERIRCVRLVSKSKEEPKKLISPPGPLPSSKFCNHENQLGNSTLRCQEAECIRQVSKSKEEPENLISPLDPFPRSKFCNHENQQGNSTLRCQEAKSNWPSWVQSILETSFFGQCKVHANVVKSPCNSYCLDCKNEALCVSCLASHEDHHVIWIRQTLYEDAVDVSAIKMHVDITGIHTHKVNSTDETILLNRIIPSWHHWAGNSACNFCKRRVPDPFYFCSLNCKFQNEQQMAVSAP